MIDLVSLSTILRYSTHFQIPIRIPECPEESECSENLNLETIIRKESHEWEEPEVGGKCESTTRTSREDRSDNSSDCSYSRLVVEVLSMSEPESLIENSYDEERKAQDHNDREKDIRIGVYFSIVSEHDSNIGEGPPDIPSE